MKRGHVRGIVEIFGREASIRVLGMEGGTRHMPREDKVTNVAQEVDEGLAYGPMR